MIGNIIDVADLGQEFFISILVNSSSTRFRLNNFQRFWQELIKGSKAG